MAQGIDDRCCEETENSASACLAHMRHHLTEKGLAHSANHLVFRFHKRPLAKILTETEKCKAVVEVRYVTAETTLFHFRLYFGRVVVRETYNDPEGRKGWARVELSERQEWGVGIYTRVSLAYAATVNGAKTKIQRTGNGCILCVI